MPIVMIKVIALLNVKINFATVELPTAYLGSQEFFIRVPVTNGPQPPPPKESIKPPTSPNLERFVLFIGAFFIFFFFLFSIFFIPR